MASKKAKEEKPVVHLANFYMKGGQTITLRVNKLETGITDNGQLASYSMDCHPEENISYMYMDPSEVAAITTRIETDNLRLLDNDE